MSWSLRILHEHTIMTAECPPNGRNVQLSRMGKASPTAPFVDFSDVVCDRGHTRETRSRAMISADGRAYPEGPPLRASALDDQRRWREKALCKIVARETGVRRFDVAAMFG